MRHDRQSVSSCYHLAGDSIVTTCLMAIFGLLLEVDYKQKIAELTEELKEKLKTDLGNYFVGIELERATRKLKSRKEKTL